MKAIGGVAAIAVAAVPVPRRNDADVIGTALLQRHSARPVRELVIADALAGGQSVRAPRLRRQVH